MENRLTNCLRCSAPLTGRGGYKKLCDTCKLEWKWCPRCETLKQLADFAPNGRTTGYCSGCHTAYNGARYDAEYHAVQHLVTKFGISREEAARLRAVECCEVCDTPPAPGDKLCVDHNQHVGFDPRAPGILKYGDRVVAPATEHAPDLSGVDAAKRRLRLVP